MQETYKGTHVQEQACNQGRPAKQHEVPNERASTLRVVRSPLGADGPPKAISDTVECAPAADDREGVRGVR